jgi:carboxylesterase
VLKHVIRSLPGIASDISKPGAHELGYDRVPVRAAATLPKLWSETVRNLSQVTQPVLVYRSTVDHVVGPASMRALLAGLPQDREPYANAPTATTSPRSTTTPRPSSRAA